MYLEAAILSHLYSVPVMVWFSQLDKDLAGQEKIFARRLIEKTHHALNAYGYRTLVYFWTCTTDIPCL